MTAEDRRTRRPGFDRDDGSCLSCDGHAVPRQNRQTGDAFYGCSNFPACRNAARLKNELAGDLLMEADDYLREWADAMYDGDGKW
jgi:ssDNA-binding Zn-finger/Zn-ribbon topoisomerase 1